ncbi:MULTISPECIES: hypothetical protein [Pseudoalteromonas]|jgi:putative effector of murein hydrolase LrgA (UPF0299 family)|uniref:Uncharacterized protein n=1 Tax=Pseudoalteromonas lipolytica TaxID=570156 RepID=A0AAD0RYL1_9GAMM|nr:MULTISPECIES: hypothetical protein [Pseudoalteromonas]AXV64955.1 hypothetical protein D0907_06555 [Pseudoalteromonas donghaensis]EWH06704.1 hypothetical protein AT00_07050 [Pseudoalteromonas lipolytica SCSIO 04301]MAE01695.1 hypothetical protein [Pseudoalteromonas sp.]MBE0351238.1 hypothetical protein [Pseudoalteromonas lipolytica LMEB 39]MCC9660985.1 hypothetical protein [Pseudoalteromonas sp. MB41]|tara:strand:- start:6439 stop:6645 length:207 start_codon:yes stop_codon:yes gene_type:complete
MNINASFINYLMLILVPFFAVMSYYLGKRKTTTPIIVAIIGGLLGLMPLFGLVFIAVLALKKDIETSA